MNPQKASCLFEDSLTKHDYKQLVPIRGIFRVLAFMILVNEMYAVASVQMTDWLRENN